MQVMGKNARVGLVKLQVFDIFGKCKRFITETHLPVQYWLVMMRHSVCLAVFTMLSSSAGYHEI